MNISRRGFIQALVSATTAAALAEIDPERFLWTPGKKTIFLPSLLTDAHQVEAEYRKIRKGGRHGVLSFDANWNLINASEDEVNKRVIVEWGEGGFFGARSQ